MSIKLKIIFAAVSLFVLSSCESIRDSYAECGVWLEFVFDHNMEYADSFDPQVKSVDVYLFDRGGKFVLSRHAGLDDLEGRRRLFLGDSRLPFGDYKVLTVGNLCGSFGFTDGNGGSFTPGVTTLEDAVLALNTSHTSREFEHLFFGLPVGVAYKADRSVWRVPLIRETNRFHILLQTVVESPDGRPEGPVKPVHTVEIVAPESGAYDYLNNPVVPTRLVYSPYSLLSRLEYREGNVVLQETAATLNTARLLENEWDGYRIIVRDIASGEQLWSNDLLSLLAATKPNKRPDGTELPRSEYFDRQGDWNIVIVYKRSGGPAVTVDPDKAFVALAIRINGWVVWQHGVGV